MSVMVEIAEIVVNAALQACSAIMKIYDFGMKMKADKSPRTKVDKNANDIIVHYLSQTGIFIVSEGGTEAAY
jgi:3'(2'), 5'-bisphosphate nucleotidase